MTTVHPPTSHRAGSAESCYSAEPLVSVIIPAFNAEAFIGDALDSVASQTWRRMEVVVVDDGSVDETIATVEAHRCPARVLVQDSRGASSARNRGIANSTGQLIAFLDADDVWLPTKIEKQVSAFLEDPSLGLVTTCHEGFSGAETFTWGHSKRRDLFEGPSLAGEIVRRSGLATPTVMIPRWVTEKVGTFNEGLRIAEDDNLWVRIVARHPARLVDEVLVRCRVRSGSLSSDTDQLFADVLDNLDLLMADPVIAPQISYAVPIRRARIFWNQGYKEMTEGRHGAARQAFISSIRHRPFSIATWVYLALTLLPASTVSALRRLKRG